MLTLDMIKPVYELGGVDGIVLFINGEEKINDSTICAQVKMYDRSVEYLELSKALKFNPFNPISNDELSLFSFRSFLYRRISDKMIFEMFDKLSIKDDDDE